MTGDSDAAVVERVLRGDAAAYEGLVRRHFRAAFAVALAHAGSHAAAEDVCQEAFFRAYQRLGECREPARFGGWLVRIVRNEALNARGRERVRRAEPLEDAGGAAVSAPERESPDAVLARAELRRSLLAALDRLPPVQREVVLLYDLEGWPHREIAGTLGLSELMSRRHLSDARRRLRGFLGDREG